MSIIDDIVIISRRNMVLGFALLIAAEEAYYKDKIVDMGMKDLLIGEEKKNSLLRRTGSRSESKTGSKMQRTN